MGHIPKGYTTHEQLVAAAAAQGITRITTELMELDWDNHRCVMQATAEGERGLFQGIGDATATNTNKGIRPHFVRMAETRAINRALRLYLGQGMTSVEELTDAPSRPRGHQDPQNRPQRRSEPPQDTKPYRWPDGVRKRFCADLGRLGIGYKDCATYCETNHLGRPSGWSHGHDEFLNDHGEALRKYAASLDTMRRDAEPDPERNTPDTEEPPF